MQTSLLAAHVFTCRLLVPVPGRLAGTTNSTRPTLTGHYLPQTLLQGPSSPHGPSAESSKPQALEWESLLNTPTPGSDPSVTHRVRPVSSPSGTSDPPLCSVLAAPDRGLASVTASAPLRNMAHAPVHPAHPTGRFHDAGTCLLGAHDRVPAPGPVRASQRGPTIIVTSCPRASTPALCPGPLTCS